MRIIGYMNKFTEIKRTIGTKSEEYKKYYDTSFNILIDSIISEDYHIG